MSECHCIECAVTAPLEPTEPYDYIPTEEEKEEIKQNLESSEVIVTYVDEV